MSALNSSEYVFDHREQFIRNKRLRKVSINAGTETFNAIAGFSFGGQEYNRDQRGARSVAQLPSKFITIHTWHANVANDEVRHCLRNLDQSFGSAARCGDVESFRSEICLERS